MRCVDGGISRADAADYVLGMFEAVRRTGGIGGLVRFHSRNKYMIMAHDPATLRELGRVLGNRENLPAAEVFARYGPLLSRALSCDATIPRHANSVMRMCGHFLARMDGRSRKGLLELVDGYRRGDIRLGRLMDAISEVVYDLDETYLAGQTYFLLYCDTRRGAGGLANDLREGPDVTRRRICRRP